MAVLDPLESLYEAAGGAEFPLPPGLADLYGRLTLPRRPGRPCVIGNFVTTLDGVAALDVAGHLGGGPISGNNPHDRAVMGLLRSAADAVIVGAGTLRASPRHLWSAEYIFPPLAPSYRELRAALGKDGPPLNVVVSASGGIDLDLPVFSSGAVPVLIVSTAEGSDRIRGRSLPPAVGIATVGGAGHIDAGAILSAVDRACGAEVILVEGGPRLMADFFAEDRLDELFLTLAPQIAGRGDAGERPGIVAGRTFAPGRPLWGALVGVKRGGSHLFLRYSFTRPGVAADG